MLVGWSGFIKMKCILHIGTEKTGTTLLQRWLYNNEEEINRNGYYLTKGFAHPNNWRIPVYFSDSDKHYFLRKERIYSKEQKALYFSNFLRDFNSELSSSRNFHTWIVTSEHFVDALKKPEEILRLQDFLKKKFSEVKIICYFREQSDMARSLYSTTLKGDATYSYDSFLDQVKPENYSFNPYKIATNWSDAFGLDHCVFRIYDKNQFIHSDIRLDFLHAIGFVGNYERLSFEISSENVSISALQAPIFQSINDHLPYMDGVDAVRAKNRWIKVKINAIDDLKYGRFHTIREREIRDMFAQVNSDFESKFISGEKKFPISEVRCEDITFRQSDVENILEKVSEVFMSEISNLVEENVALENILEGGERPPTLYRWFKYQQVMFDYRIHKWLSEMRFVSSKKRMKFKGVAEKRMQKLKSGQY